MVATQVSSRRAHAPGFTNLCVAVDGSCFVSCGFGGDVHIWTDLDEEFDTRSVEDKITAVSCSGKLKSVFAALETHVLQVFDLPEFETNGIVAKCSHQVTHVLLGPQLTHMLAASCDGEIKWVEIKSNAYKLFSGHEGPVLSIAIDPREEFFISAGADGDVRVWSISEHACVKILQRILPKFNDFDSRKPLARGSWVPKSGDKFCLTVDKEVRFYERTTWQLAFTLTADSIVEALSICCFSDCGKFLAASAVDGRVLLWDIESRKCIFSMQHEKKVAITALAWHPLKKTELLFCDVEGNISAFVDVIEPLVEPAKARASVPLSSGDGDGGNSFADGGSNADFDDDSPIKSRRPSANPRDFGETESDEDEPFGRYSAKARAKQLPIDDDENTRGSDLGALKARYGYGVKEENEDFADDGLEQKGKSELLLAKTVTPPPSWTPIAQQPPFVPGSTPEDLPQRFMKWNSVGVIRQYNTDDEQSIDVEFHDVSVHHAIHLDNSTTNYTMADMSTEALCFASPCMEDASSRLSVMYFSAWDQAREWTVDLPIQEDIVCVCLGVGFVAVATDFRMIRIFTLSGIQRELFSVPGAIVAMAAHDDKLAFAYHSGMGGAEDQSLAVSVYKVVLSRMTAVVRPLINFTPLPLSAKSTLTWLGFTQEGTFVYADSCGVVRLANFAFNLSFIPIAYTKEQAKGKSDNMWLVAVNENPCQIRCIYCKGSTFPALLPRPTVTLLSWKLPFVEMETDKAQFEEQLYQSSLRQSNLRLHGRSNDETAEELRKSELDSILKLFLLACKAERDSRALEVARLAPTSQAVQVLINAAERLRRMVLAEKLSDVALEKAQCETEEETGHSRSDEFDAYSPPRYITNVLRRKSAASSNARLPKRFSTESVTQRRRKSPVVDITDDHSKDDVIHAMHNYEDSNDSVSNSNSRPVSRGQESEDEDFQVRTPLFRPQPVRLSSDRLSGSGSRGNPFKKNEATDSAIRQIAKGDSVFDSIKAENTRKSTALSATESSKTSAKRKSSAEAQPFKQAKLNFASNGKHSSKDASNTSAGETVGSNAKTHPESKLTSDQATTAIRSGFSLWLDNEKELLLAEFNASEDCENEQADGIEFNRFAIRKFRRLSTDEKNLWNEKATACGENTLDDSNTKNPRPNTVRNTNLKRFACQE